MGGTGKRLDLGLTLVLRWWRPLYMEEFMLASP